MTLRKQTILFVLNQSVTTPQDVCNISAALI